MTDLSAAVALFVRIAYSTLHGLTLMIGALRKSAASGLIPNADTKNKRTKTRRDRISAVSLFA
ncbi:hypothetical protein DW884_17835 [Ruminococcus sp. AM40-10AC]|nr:hypothetical protein DW884_17835 [Ruminococcus sp. AM40-10AC]